jgi:hypothetical protein
VLGVWQPLEQLPSVAHIHTHTRSLWSCFLLLSLRLPHDQISGERAHTHAHAYTHIHIRTHTYTHIHTHTPCLLDYLMTKYHGLCVRVCLSVSLSPPPPPSLPLSVSKCMSVCVKCVCVCARVRDILIHDAYGVERSVGGGALVVGGGCSVWGGAVVVWGALLHIYPIPRGRRWKRRREQRM